MAERQMAAWVKTWSRLPIRRQPLARYKREVIGAPQEGCQVAKQVLPLKKIYPAVYQVPRDATVSVAVVLALFEAAEHAGVPRLTLMQAAKLEPDQIEKVDSRVPRTLVNDLCELALDLSGDPALGLHWAEKIGEGTFVPISALIAHSANLRQALAELAQYHRLLSDQTSYEFIEHEEQVMVHCLSMAGAPTRVQRFSAEMMVAGFYRLLRYFSADARPCQLSFRFTAPAYSAEYHRIFDQTPLFEQPFTGLVFDRALMDARAPCKDEEVHEVLQALAERRLQRITRRTPYALRVRDVLVQRGGPERVDMKTVARALGLSVRSLRRRLDGEGKPYHALANEALAMIAKNLLYDKQLTIQQTAHEMGFSDASTFHRAFKSWTGTTPGEYLRTQRR